MQGFYERTQDFTADFKQEYLYRTFNRTVVSTGTVAFQKNPGERFVTVTGLGNHLHIRLEIDKHRHAMPQHGMVIYQHHF